MCFYPILITLFFDFFSIKKYFSAVFSVFLLRMFFMQDFFVTLRFHLIYNYEQFFVLCVDYTFEMSVKEA